MWHAVKCSRARPPADAPSVALAEAEPGTWGWLEAESLLVVALRGGEVLVPATGAQFAPPPAARFWPAGAGGLVTVRVGG